MMLPDLLRHPATIIGGPAHSFPSFFLFWWEAEENFLFWPSPNSFFPTNRPAPNSRQFFDTMEIAPPHDREIAFSFQRRWLLNSLISDHQCTYFLIVRALTISNFCFSCSCGRSYEKTKNTVFREVVDDEDHENILSLALHALPQHGDGAVSTPRRSPPRPLTPSHLSVVRSSAGEGGETMMTTMMIREAMTPPTVSNPLRPTHNNQP
jgi:hypothetical protein